MVQQYYKTTLPQAIAHYERGDLTAKGLLHFYFKIKIRPGWKLRRSVREICQELGIRRATFYAAMSRLKSEGILNWEVPEETQFSIEIFNDIYEDVCQLDNSNPDSSVGDCDNLSDQSRIVDNPSTIVDNQSKIVDNPSIILDNQSTIVDAKTPQPAPVRNSGTLHNSSSNSLQDFLHSLSQEAREKFLSFCDKEVQGFPRPIASLPDYLGAIASDGKPRFQDFYQRFCRTEAGKEAQEETLNDELNESVYETFEAQFRALDCDYLDFFRNVRRASPEWHLRLKFVKVWKQRNGVE